MSDVDLMNDPTENSEFYFPENLNVLLGEVSLYLRTQK